MCDEEMTGTGPVYGPAGRARHMKSLGECLREAIPTGPHICRDRERLTRAEFEAMPVAANPCNLPVSPYVDCKVLIGGKWHVCQRQYQFGQPIHFARPITVILSGLEAETERGLA